MPQRTPPQWFSAKLKAIDRRLDVYWHAPIERWVIAERVPRVSFVGHREGMALYRFFHRPERVFLFDELGSGILDYLRRVDMKRFGSVSEMVEALDLDAVPDSIPNVGTVAA